MQIETISRIADLIEQYQMRNNSAQKSENVIDSFLNLCRFTLKNIQMIICMMQCPVSTATR